MKTALISIKNEFAEKIYSGEKQVEFRRNFNPEIEFCWVYTGGNVKKITGCFMTFQVVRHPIASLWRKYNQVGGIDERRFFDYFAGKEYGFGIRIAVRHRFSVPVDPYHLYKFGGPPQDHPGFNGDGTFRPPIGYYECPWVLNNYLYGVLKKEGAAGLRWRQCHEKI